MASATSLFSRLAGMTEFGIIQKVVSDSVGWGDYCRSVKPEDVLRPLAMYDILGFMALFGIGKTNTIDVLNTN